jgi:hypothetical protein
MQVDLFGDAIRQPSVKKHTERKAITKVVFNRKALWSSSGYLLGIKEVEEREVADATSTSDTRSDNATIERLEIALGLAPLVKNGQWVTNELGFVYRRVGKPFNGARPFGPKGSLLRDLTRQQILNSARTSIEPLFSDPCSWLVVNSVAVLYARLKLMDDNEDAFSCLQAFLQVIAQHDFIDSSRKGQTIRFLTKRDQMREMRASARKSKEEREANKPIPKDLMDSWMDEDCSSFDDN